MCSKCLKRVTLLVCCVWSMQNLWCLLGGGADGAEFLQFAVLSWSSPAMGVDLVNFA